MLVQGDIVTYLERLRALREDADIKQNQIAKILGIAQNTYSQYENGKRAMPIEALIILCRYYKVSADDILGLRKRK